MALNAMTEATEKAKKNAAKRKLMEVKAAEERKRIREDRLNTLPTHYEHSVKKALDLKRKI